MGDESESRWGKKGTNKTKTDCTHVQTQTSL